MNKKAYVSIIIVLIVLVLITGSYTAIHFFLIIQQKNGLERVLMPEIT